MPILSTIGAACARAYGFTSGLVKDQYFNLVSLLLPGNGTNGATNNSFLDSSSNAFTVTRNGNTTQGSFSPFSQTGWGGAFNTSTTYLTVTDTSNLRFGSSNFTIEAWVYRSASGATQTIASKGASTPTGWVFQISSADKLVFTDTSTSITGATSIAANTWAYVAVVRAGTGSNQTTLYVNGASDGTGTSSTNFNQTSNMLIGADRSTTNFANGYISNLRLSNTNRTISSTPTTALTADANTIFLSLNINRFQYTDSTAAYTNISTTGTPSVVAFSPFAPTAAYTTSVVGGSGYFDGNNDYLIGPTSNAAFDLGTGAYTLEAWVYLTSLPTEAMVFCQGNANNALIFSVLSTGALSLGKYGVGGQIATSSGDVPLNSWNHVAIVRTSTATNDTRLYVNGVLKNTGTDNNNWTVNTTPTVGGLTVSGYFVNGYISSVRVVKGTAITPPSGGPTSPLTAVSGTSLLLNFTNAGIFDATAKNDLETVGNAQISTTISAKWGSGSMYFNGSGSYLMGAASQQYEFGSGDFTVECWVNISAAASDAGIVGKGPVGSVNNTIWSIEFVGTGNTIGFYVPAAAGSFIITGTTNMKTSTWIHVAVCKSGNNTRLFINGTQEGSTYTTGYTISQGNNLYVGGGFYAPTTRTITGYVNDLRFTKFARYTANFTPPTAAFPVQ